MHTVVLTSLFPPDPSPVAQYTKLLATRLRVTPRSLVVYGALPESVPDVTIYPISKRTSRIARVYHCFNTLWTLRPKVLIVQNGPSVDVPALIYSFFSNTKIIYVISDHHAAANPRNTLNKTISQLLQKRSQQIVVLPKETTVYLSPERLPFGDTSPNTLPAHNDWWDEHLANFNTV